MQNELQARISFSGFVVLAPELQQAAFFFERKGAEHLSFQQPQRRLEG